MAFSGQANRLVALTDQHIEFGKERPQRCVSFFQGRPGSGGHGGDALADRVLPSSTTRQADGRPRHAIDQQACRMLAVGEQRGIDDRPLEQRDLQAPDTCLDGVGEVGVIEDGLEDQSHGVDGDRFRLAQRQVEIL